MINIEYIRKCMGVPTMGPKRQARWADVWQGARALRSAALLMFLIVLTLAGCSGSAGRDAAGYYHGPGWLAGHPGPALADVGKCTLCHEMNLLREGSSIPNCLTAACHHNTLPGYALPGLHGAQAKAHQRATGGGMGACQLCHGQDFQGGAATVTCFKCHQVPAPHPAKPWLSTTGGSNHDTTDPGNAAVCARCHFPGSAANPANHPATPAAAGTAPGCFNNTLCHGPDAAPHALGSVWKDPTSAAFHGLQAKALPPKAGLLYCQSCHGTLDTIRFDGGAAPTSCASATCHPAAGAHPTTWAPAPAVVFPGYVASHRTAQDRDNACPVCHDYTRGRSAPNPAAPSCFSSLYNNTSCHANGPGAPDHPVPFLGAAHNTVSQAGFDATCSNCHAPSGTSPLAAAPLCGTCHQAASPLAVGNCASCHEKPPAGSLFPDVQGTHPKHNALAGVTGLCAACHNGADSGTLGHYNQANARPGLDSLRKPPGATSFLATYQGKVGTAAYAPAAGTCSSISCHGGITTPSWAGGTLASGTEAGCHQCHSLGTGPGAPENNSPYSGLHAFHLGAPVSALCTDCHAMANGTPGANNHFAALNTPQMEGPAADTVAPLGLASNYTRTGQTCTLTCHNQVHTAYSWTGAANHPIPFLGSAHTTVNQAGFTGVCANCHAVTGSSPLLLAPLCTTCHLAGSPLTVTQCASCHTKPPAGSAFPDTAGKHAKHDALAGVTGACGACHTGFDSGTQGHYDHANARPGKNSLNVPPAPTGFDAAYNAKGANAAFDPVAQTCSSVSCHGGIVTPSWQTGSINGSVDAGCKQCHALGTALGTPQANSPFSGQHRGHLGGEIGALCTDCHTMTGSSAGALNHYAFLKTALMEGPASSTLTPGGSAANYNAAARTCTLTCHGENHNNRSW